MYPPHSSTLAWKIPWMKEPGGLQSMGSLRVGHDWATSLSLFPFMHWWRKCQPTPVFLPGESQGQGSWWAAVYGVAQSRTRLKWLNSNRTCIRPTKETEPNFLCQYGLVIKNRSFRIRCIWSWLLVLSFITCVTMIRLTSSLHFYM